MAIESKDFKDNSWDYDCTKESNSTYSKTRRCKKINSASQLANNNDLFTNAGCEVQLESESFFNSGVACAPKVHDNNNSMS